ncbi:hypothetical protein Pmani_025317 [Petrolisthes manimaculis]|uniref:Major facilitator superfamily (MFS) profile domain-containing protein n=1 Tax=Petrolisthes manimaculis TaxID=1843537 RepID=A0AAE1P8G7_9EUCA|nr:hypothetical protein Pmani_025317 [Petrolisthes manimaculis]
MGGILGKGGSWVVDHSMDEIPLSVAMGKSDLRHGSIASVTSRFACLATVTFFIGGNVMYSLLYVFQDAGGRVSYWAMFVSRFVVGVSSANVTLCRSYLAGSTTLKERTSGIAIIAAAQSLGFVVGPGIQAVMTILVPSETKTAGGWIIWDKFTACGWIAAALGLINFVILTPWVFQEFNIAEKERALIQQRQGRNKDIKLPTPDYLPLVGILFSFFVSIFIFVLLETLAEPFVSDQYAWEEDKCMIVVGISLSVGGLIAFGIFPMSGVLSKRYDERKVMLYPGYIPLIIGTFLLIPFAGKDIPISVCYNTTTTMEPTTFSTESYNMTDYWNQGILPYSDEDGETCTLGCPESQEWCNDVNQLPLPQLAVGYLIVMFGYPLVQSLNMAIFSKILGPKPQGLWMGVLTAVGSLARVLGPLFVSAVYTMLGTVWTFSILLVGMVLAFIELHLIYPRLVPMNLEEIQGHVGPAGKEKY